MDTKYYRVTYYDESLEQHSQVFISGTMEDARQYVDKAFPGIRYYIQAYSSFEDALLDIQNPPIIQNN